MTFKSPVLAAILFLGSVTVAQAQATRTWVSGVGDDVNPCSRTAPCKTFAGAISKTAAGGEINAIDPGGYGAVTITKSITIDGGGTFASILAAGTNGIIVNAAASDIVTIRNVSIDGANTGINGIRFLAGGALHIEKCEIFGFAGRGIDAEPAGGSTMYVLDTVLRNNDGGGILIKPGVYLGTSLDKVRLDGNFYGVRAENNANVTIRDSIAAGNSTHGFHAFSTGAGILINLENSTATNNGGGGVTTSGAAAGISISNSTIMSNAQGINTSAGGSVLLVWEQQNYRKRNGRSTDLRLAITIDWIGSRLGRAELEGPTMSRSLPSFEEVSAPVFVPAFLHTNLSCQQNVSSED